jgi:hypothetical protein
LSFKLTKTMGDWIGLGIFVLVLAGAFFGLAHLGKPAKPLTREEYERRVGEGRGLMSAGVMASMYALQKLFNPKAVEAIEAERDLKAGYYDDEESDGEADDPGPLVKGQGPADEGEGDA